MPRLVRFLFKNVVWNIPDSNHLYLTFDDGPHPDSTMVILDALKNQNIKATFFLTGKNALNHPHLIEAIESEGHMTANHGYEHISGWKTGAQKYIDNATQSAQYARTKLFRPPYGRLSLRQYRRLKEMFPIIMWSNMPGDFDNNLNTSDMHQRAHQNFEEGSIIVLHDSPGNLENTLSFINALDTDKNSFDILSDETF